MQITSILTDAVLRKATDVHLLSGMPVMMRVAGKLVPANDRVLDPDQARDICYSLLSEEEISTFEQNHDLDIIRTFG